MVASASIGNRAFLVLVFLRIRRTWWQGRHLALQVRIVQVLLFRTDIGSVYFKVLPELLFVPAFFAALIVSIVDQEFRAACLAVVEQVMSPRVAVFCSNWYVERST
jgi:hypothetical protein